MTLELIPNSDLLFKGPFNVVSTTTLKLANNGNDRLAYKIKTTAPKRYCVKPNSGFLDSHANVNIQVMLQPQAPGQPDDRSKHKFMVQWVSVPSNYTEDVDNFWKQDLKGFSVQDARLKCTFADDQTAAVVPNDSHGHRDLDAPTSRATESINATETRAPPQASSTLSNQPSSPISSQRSNPLQVQSQDRQQDTGDDSSRSRLKQEIDRLKEENEVLKERLKQQENGLRQRTIAGNSPSNQYKTSQQQQKPGLVLFGITFTEQLVLVAFTIALLFGFSLGYFLFSCSN
jgi:hypothetical protein